MRATAMWTVRRKGSAGQGPVSLGSHGPTPASGRRGIALGVLILALVLTPSRARAAEPGYLSQMPTSQRVLAAMRGSDRLDTWTRQYAAINVLLSMIRSFQAGDPVGNRLGDQTAGEQRLIHAYNAARGSVEEELGRSVGAGQDPNALHAKMIRQALGYETSGSFRQTVMKTFFSPAFQASYAKAESLAAKRGTPLPPITAPPPASTSSTSSGGLPWWMFVGLFGVAALGGGLRFRRPLLVWVRW